MLVLKHMPLHLFAHTQLKYQALQSHLHCPAALSGTQCALGMLRADAGRVTSPAYRLLPADLRRIHSLEEALEGGGFDFGAPTLVLCECVLVYMEAEESAALVRWLGDRLRCAAMAVYEQVGTLRGGRIEVLYGVGGVGGKRD